MWKFLWKWFYEDELDEIYRIVKERLKEERKKKAIKDLQEFFYIKEN